MDYGPVVELWEVRSRPVARYIYHVDIGEKRSMYIVHACAMKGVMFDGTRPLKEYPRG